MEGVIDQIHILTLGFFHRKEEAVITDKSIKSMEVTAHNKPQKRIGMNFWLVWYADRI